MAKTAQTTIKQPSATFEEDFATLTAQIDDAATSEVIRQALLAARTNIIKTQIRALQTQANTLRKLLPARTKRTKTAS